MKILVLGKYYPPVLGGIETHVQDLARTISPHHQMRILVHNDGPQTVREQVDGVELVRAGTAVTLMKQPISPAMFREVRDFDADVIHLHWPNPWAALVAWLGGGKTPLVIAHHCDVVGREPFRTVVRWLYRAVVGRAKAVIVAKHGTYAGSDELGGLKRELVEAPYCVEPSPFRDEPGFKAEAEAVRRERFGDDPVAVFVGRLVPYKGLKFAIDALVETPRLRLVLIGGGPLRDELEAQARDRGVADRVVFMGPTDERTKNLWLAASDFMVLPSITINEAFGLVQVEAMHWSKPVITTDIPSGVPEVGVHGETGLVVRSSNAPALAEAMRTLIADPALRDRMGRAGAVRAEALYSEAAFTRNFLDVYARASGQAETA